MITIDMKVDGTHLDLRTYYSDDDPRNVALNEALQRVLGSYGGNGVYRVPLSESNLLTETLVMLAAAHPESLRLIGVLAVIAAQGGAPTPQFTFVGPPAVIRVALTDECLNVDLIDGDWFASTVSELIAEGSVPEGNRYRVPLALAYRALLGLAIIRTAKPEMLRLEGMFEAVTIAKAVMWSLQ